MLKRILISLAIPLFGLFILTPSVSATSLLNQVCTGSDSTASVCQDSKTAATKSNPVITILKNVISVLAFAIGILSVIMIIVAGLRMIASNGDAQTISRSRDSIIYAIVGIIVAVSAEAIVAFVLNKIS